MAKSRAEQIDAAVEAAVRGKPPAAPARRARGLSAAEKYQIDAENKGYTVSGAKLDRLRKAQTTDGANGR